MPTPQISAFNPAPHHPDTLAEGYAVRGKQDSMPARQGERRETKVWPPAHLEELLRRAGKILRDAGAEEVYVFGSAATGQMHERSDIDLAVQGLPPRRFIRAMLKAEDIFDRPVDLVELSDDTPFTRYLVRGGKLRRVA